MNQRSMRIPLVVILGATGTGKTKLSLELGQKFNGEIIGADSMQIYNGLDIITAKATPDEQKLIPHHLINILEPHEKYTVCEYRNKAVKIIDSLLSRNKLPIIVGGTNYYIESLLWKILVDDAGTYMKYSVGTLPLSYHDLPSEELHKKLQILDPNMAKRLHPNNKRKILRSLEVLYLSGRKHSEILTDQQSSKDGSRTGGGLRYTNALIFKLQCDKTTLDERLNERVNNMIEQGLVEELTDFHKAYNENRIIEAEIPDYTKGIFQCIGFKEFHPYLTMTEEAKNSEDGIKVFEKCVENLKMATRRYARKQNHWTTNRFLGRHDRDVPPMYSLDTEDISQWENNVLLPAIEIIENFMLAVPSQHQPLQQQKVNSTPNADDETYICDVCERVFVGQFQWDLHIKSKKHKKVLQHKNKLRTENL